MKKILSLLFCLLFIGAVIAQEKYTVPEVSVADKLNRTYFQFWGLFAAGVDYAKSNDISPYEYGKYIGNFFAPSWDKDAGFEGFVNGMIYNWEHFKTDEDGPMILKENDDGSVVLKIPIESWKKYLPEDNPFAPFEEVMECMQGILEQIADYLGSSVVMKITEEYVIHIMSKK